LVLCIAFLYSDWNSIHHCTRRLHPALLDNWFVQSNFNSCKC
jgi:hypothetical protein